MDHRLVRYVEGEACVRLWRADIVEARFYITEGEKRAARRRRPRGQDKQLDELRALHARANAAAGNSSQSSRMFAVTRACAVSGLWFGRAVRTDGATRSRAASASLSHKRGAVG